MKFVLYRRNGVVSLGAMLEAKLFGASTRDLTSLLLEGNAALKAEHAKLLAGEEIDASSVDYLPPFPAPEKIICMGLNYRDHATESGFEIPKFPVLFSRFASSLVGHNAPIVRPTVSEQLDFEGELAMIVGKAGRNIPKERALDYVAGYSVFNDGSIRDYQFKSAQWMIGKNFDGTGGFGPSFVTADELPAGGSGLQLTTRLNGEVMQSAKTDNLIFDIATQIAELSECVTLRPGDVFVTGTPSGVGVARSPKIFMKPGDVCEVEIEGIGLLSNPIVQQSASA